MKKITNETILKQGDKIYQPVEVDGVIYWVGKDLVGINSETISNYCPNSNQVFLGYFEANDDELYQGIGKIHPKEIVAQSQPKLDGIPVISLDSYVDSLAKIKGENKFGLALYCDYFKEGYKSNPNQYTQKDIEKAIELARERQFIKHSDNSTESKYNHEEIIEQINSISIIEVDEQFNIINGK